MRTAVASRTDTVFHPYEHKHIIVLRFDDGSELGPGEVVEALERGERLLSANGGEVVAKECPDCGAYPYLFAAE